MSCVLGTKGGRKNDSKVEKTKFFPNPLPSWKSTLPWFTAKSLAPKTLPMHSQ